MYELKKNGKVFTSKFLGTRPLSYEKRIYRVSVSQSLRNTGIDHQLVPYLLFDWHQTAYACYFQDSTGKPQSREVPLFWRTRIVHFLGPISSYVGTIDLPSPSPPWLRYWHLTNITFLHFEKVLEILKYLKF